MSSTPGAWTESTVNNHYVAQCDVVQTGATEEYCATLKTPSGLDTSKPFVLIVNSEAATLDGSTLPVDIYIGYSTSSACTVAGAALTLTAAVLLNPDVIADVSSAAGSVIVDPNLNIADDADDLVRGAEVPYYIFVLDGASTLSAATCRFIVVQ